MPDRRTGGRLQHQRPAHLFAELAEGDLSVLGRTQVEPARPGDAERGRPASHRRLVLGEVQRVRPGVHGHAVGEQCPDDFARHVLVVEGHNVAVAGEFRHVARAVVADHHVAGHQSGPVIG
jgi:hypothetical protein